MGKRRIARELGLKLLYQLELVRPEAQEATVRAFWEDHPTETDVELFASLLVKTVLDHRQDIDRIIKESVDNWELNRIARVERNLLRLATAEMLYLEDVPPKASINEAIEIAKMYGSTKRSFQFINGVLNNVYRRYII
ncbi:MAG: transcription antitermination factor NusB [Candidatus Zixiibacteriota bacterium]